MIFKTLSKMQRQNFFLKSVFVFGIFCYGFFQISEALQTETEYTNDANSATNSSQKDYGEAQGDTSGIVDGSPATRIAGGKDTTWKMYPYNVVVLNGGSFKCGGSLIANNKVLTAAKCVYGLEEEDVRIRIGSDFHNTGGTVIKVSAICPHPLFKAPFGIAYDVAVLTLTKTSNVKPLRLAQVSNTDNQYLNYKANVTGWGDIAFNKNNPTKKLKVTSVKGISHQDCKNGFEDKKDQDQVNKAVMCFGKDASTCNGDYGGPLVRLAGKDGINSQIGVANTNICDRGGQPNSYARIADKDIRDFIVKKCGK